MLRCVAPKRTPKQKNIAPDTMPQGDRISFAIRVVDDERRTATVIADESCHICRETFCEDDECCRTMTSLKCCTQTICCACATKMAMRCTCTEECSAIIAYCPYCRMVSPLQAIDVFLGHTKPCRACCAAEASAVEEAVSVSASSVHGQAPEQPEADTPRTQPIGSSV